MKAEGRDEFGGADTMDVISAIEWLSSISWIDNRRIHLLGFSRGAINLCRGRRSVTTCIQNDSLERRLRSGTNLRRTDRSAQNDETRHWRNACQST